ncbi:hypothetical protein [Flavobacterium facile]|uniref:hypothetical protein n=1 Tax=Flavobacterium facile TaxID=2893174 RepID=UPI002E765E2D|nr:hypothetical protein [Flavobacterium sp. T-12]
MKKENKNIERLFQEKFKDFEVSPPDIVWENIQEKLHPKEKKRRVIPFWFKTAGIAASFVAIMSVLFFNRNTDFNNSNTNNSNAVVTSENNNNNNQKTDSNLSNSSESHLNKNKSNSTFINESGNNSDSNSLVNNVSATSSSKNGSSNSKTDSKLNKSSLDNSKTYKSNGGFVSNQKNKIEQNIYKENKKYYTSSASGIAATKNYKNNTNTKSNSSKSKKPSFNDFNSSKTNNSNSGLTDINTIKTFNRSKNNNSSTEIIDVNTFNKFNTSKNNDSNSGLTDINNFNSTPTTLNKNTNSNGILIENGLENSITNSIAITAIEDIKIDTITLATVTIEENPMEKLLREKETKKVADEKEKWSKWAVNSFVSPIFFNSFENGSPISDEFATNEKTYNNSTSYGVGIAYNVNKRLSVKTGVSNLNLDYDTQNIAFYSSFEDQSKIANTNIERNTNGKYLVLKHEKDISKNVSENQIIQSSQNLGNLNQRTQYIEVPLEVSYAILNKKIGVAIKGGMSTLFLTENAISISGNDGNVQIGKASNLNNVHFSSNVGLGLSYNFMKNFQLNVEPTLKYQINTFNKNAEDFSPYVIGVNTGISYKF